MITFSNLQEHSARPFSDYLQMGGYSHSFLKNNIAGVAQYIEPTEKMRFGSLVDAILTGTGADLTDPNYQHACIAAAYIAQKFPYLHKCKKQLPCTGIAHYRGLQMPMRTLIDFVVPTVASIEMKITASKLKQVENLIGFMGYHRQVFIEKSLAGVPKGYILIYSTTDKACYFRECPVGDSEQWLASKILEHGTVATN